MHWIRSSRMALCSSRWTRHHAKCPPYPLLRSGAVRCGAAPHPMAMAWPMASSQLPPCCKNLKPFLQKEEGWKGFKALSKREGRARMSDPISFQAFALRRVVCALSSCGRTLCPRHHRMLSGGSVGHLTGRKTPRARFQATLSVID